jgi:hypothetical protein
MGSSGRKSVSEKPRSPGAPCVRAARAIAQTARQHRRTAHLGRGRRRLRHCLQHHALQGALTQLAERQPDQELLLCRRRSGQQFSEQPAPLGGRAGTGDRSHPLEHAVHFGHRERGRGSGSRRPRLQDSRRTRTELALSQLAGQVRHADGDLVRRQLAQARRQRGDLLGAP